jgi:hypothetical protein
VVWDALQPAGANLVAVDGLTALPVRRTVAQQVVQLYSCLGWTPYRGSDCEGDGLSLWTNTRQRGLEPTYEPQSHLVEPEAKLRGADSRAMISRSTVSASISGGSATIGTCPSKSGWPESSLPSALKRITPLCRLPSARYKRGLDRSP